MPIIGPDKFHFFRPEGRVSDVRVTPTGQASTAIPTGEGVRAVTQAAHTTARVTEQFGAALQAQVEESKYSRAMAMFHQTAVRREIEADRMEEWEKAPEWLLQQLNDDMGTIASGIGFEGARNKFSQQAQNILANSHSRVSWKTRTRQVDELAAGMFEDIDAHFKALNERPEDWQAHEMEMVRLIEAGVGNGLIGAAKGQEYTASVQERIDELRIKGLMSRMYGGEIAPGVVAAEISDTRNYTRLDPLRRQEYVQTILRETSRLERDAIDREWTLEQREHTRMRQRQDATLNEISADINGWLSGAEGYTHFTAQHFDARIIEAHGNRKLNHNQVNSLQALLKTDAEQDDLGQVIEAYETIRRGGTMHEIARMPGLTQSTKSQFIQRAASRAQTAEKDILGQYEDYIRAHIITTGPLQNMDTGEQVRYRNALIEFNGAIDQARQEGRVIDPEFIKTTADTAVRKYGPTQVNLQTWPNIVIKGKPYVPDQLVFSPSLMEQAIREALASNDTQAIAMLKQLQKMAEQRQATEETQERR